MATRNRHGREPVGVVSLSGIEHMSESEKTARIKAVVNDMTASIIYLGKHAEAGNVTPDQVSPLHKFIADISHRERTEREKLLSSLEETEKQVERMKLQHRGDIEELIKAAAAELNMLRREMGRAESDGVPSMLAKAVAPEDQPENQDDVQMATPAQSPADAAMAMGEDGAEEVDENASEASSRTLSARSSAD